MVGANVFYRKKLYPKGEKPVPSKKPFRQVQRERIFESLSLTYKILKGPFSVCQDYSPSRLV